LGRRTTCSPPFVGPSAAMQLKLAVLGAVGAQASFLEHTKNPIRKVVDLLQKLGKEIEDESSKAKKMYNKYMCYCDTNTASLEKDIEEEKEHISELEANMKELSGQNAQLEAEIQDAQESLEANKKTIAEATVMRNNEAAQYASESSELKDSIAALAKAIPALKKGMENGSFLQASTWLTVQQQLLAALPQKQRAVVASELQSGSTDSGQILGVLEQMKESFESTLASATEEEQEAINTFNQLVGAKTDEINAASTAIEDKEARIAKQKQQIGDDTEDKEDTEVALEADESYLQKLSKDCKEATNTYEEESKARADELAGIAEAIKILNDDDTLELLKKSMSDSSFIQRSAETSRPREVQRALEVLAPARANPLYRGQLSLLMLSMKVTHRGHFDAVKKMVYKMIDNVKKEQAEQDEKKNFCDAEIKDGETKEASKKSDQKLIAQRAEQAQENVKTIKEEIKMLTKEIKELDAAVKEATETRQQKNAEFQKETADKNAAVDLLRKAKSVLAKTFGASLLQKHQTKDAQALDEMFGSFVQMDTVEEAESAQLDQFLDSSSSSQAQPDQAGKKNNGAAGMSIVNVLQQLIGDLNAELAEGKATEAAEQKAYEELMADSQETRAAKAKDITDKEEEQATEEQVLEELESASDDLGEELKSVKAKLDALHEQCDFLLKQYDDQKKARNEVLESLHQSIAVLNGAKFD